MKNAVEELEPLYSARVKEEVVFDHVCNYGDIAPDGYKIVYVIIVNDTNKVKIGITENLEDRVKQLKTMCPMPIRVLFQFHTIGFEFENYLHRKFKENRLHGEWFRLDNKMVEELNRLRDIHTKLEEGVA